MGVEWECVGVGGGCGCGEWVSGVGDGCGLCQEREWP